jgi:hypothetical protein
MGEGMLLGWLGASVGVRLWWMVEVWSVGDSAERCALELFSLFSPSPLFSRTGSGDEDTASPSACAASGWEVRQSEAAIAGPELVDSFTAFTVAGHLVAV